MTHRVSAVLLAALALALAPAATRASDGTPDVQNLFPAVGIYFVASVSSTGAIEASPVCSGTLITPRLFLTAAHCTFFDSRRLAAPGDVASVDAWVSLDPVALENDFRCFLVDGGHPNASALPCDRAHRTQPAPTFRKASSAGVSHPDYPTLSVLGTGSRFVRELLAPGDTDLAVLFLEEPVDDVTPLPTLEPGVLASPGSMGTPLLAVGYGLSYHKSIPATPTQPGGAGPTTFAGDFGVRRIADVGAIRSLSEHWIVPTQHNARGEDAVCYGDSGGPLFLVQNAVVRPSVAGVLTGGALWCMGARDPYQRVDNASARAFLACVQNAQTALEACRCGAEEKLGLCP